MMPSTNSSSKPRDTARAIDRVPSPGRFGRDRIRGKGGLAGLVVWLVAWSVACSSNADPIELSAFTFDAGKVEQPSDFICAALDDVACQLEVHYSCRRVGDFVETVRVDCGSRNQQCLASVGCISCVPGRRRCVDCSGQGAQEDCDAQAIEQCLPDGSGYSPVAACDLAGGLACVDGACEDLCVRAGRNRSYVGCEFFAADLDNAGLDLLNDASAQQFAVAVANPHGVSITVGVEIDEADPEAEPRVRTLIERTVPPYFLEVFELPRREVDGSSATGINDGTHSAITANAFRIWSTHPVTAYQFNPLDNANVFSNDASLLLPTSAIGRRYSVVSWPQTIGNSDDPLLDFDPDRSDEDLRAFLTVIGTQANTDVQIRLGDLVQQVVGADRIPESGPGETISLNIGRFDVVNLETSGTLGDFTGSTVTASKAVTVFVGSEASDVPNFEDLSTRRCCADHLEEQLFPDETLGLGFVVAHMPSRTRAVNAAVAPGTSIGVAEVTEPEWVRVLAIEGASGSTTVRTSLPPPDDVFSLNPLQDRILRAESDFSVLADRPVAVLQALPSQEVTGIPRGYPGGDPALVLVPPQEQFREDYIFLTPDKYAFDFVTVVVEQGADALLDGSSVLTDPRCEAGNPLAVDNGVQLQPPRRYVVYRCQLSFPEIRQDDGLQVLPGVQDDGVHRLVSNRPAGLVVYGFDSFVSYAYAGGLDLEVLF